MRGLQVVVLSTIVAWTVAGPVSPLHSGSPLNSLDTLDSPADLQHPLHSGSPLNSLDTLDSPADLQQQSLIASSPSFLSRPRRWLLSWLIGYGGLLGHSQGKREIASNDTVKQQEHSDTTKEDPRIENNSDKKSSKGYGVRHNVDEDSSAESVNLPAVAPVDLSGDTRVNYQDGRGRVGSLASETAAEVFDWDLLQEDMDRNAGNENPHYFQSSSSSHSRNTRPVSHSSSSNGVLTPTSSSNGVRAPSSSSYGVRERPVSGFVRRTNSDGQKLNRFNRFPISFDQSQEFANRRTQS